MCDFTFKNFQIKHNRKYWNKNILPFMILFVSLHEKQKINHGKFLVEVPEYLKIAAHQCKLQYTKSNLQESVSHVINALSLNYVLCDNFTFKLANMFLKELLSSKNFLSYKMTGNEKLTWQI